MTHLLFEKAKEKNLRLYIEYPSYIPGFKITSPRTTSLERVIVTSDSNWNLNKMQILALHDCSFIPLNVADPLLAVSKVAGFDRAIYGLDEDSETMGNTF